MSDSSKSSSTEQQQAESIAFEIVKDWLHCDLQANCNLYLSDNQYTYIQPDFYSEKDLIIGEIFSHIGSPKKAQDNKIANDILKMLLLEKVTGKSFRKILVVCDDATEKRITGLSALAESIRQFGIEVKRIDYPEEIRQGIISAQLRQQMVNK